MHHPRLAPLGRLSAPLVLLIALSQQLQAGSIRYTVTDIGAFRGANLTIPYGINNAGDIVGVSYYTGRPDGTPREGGSFLYRNGQMTHISVSRARDVNDSGQWADGGVASETAINASGQTVGMSESGRAFLRSGGFETDLGTLPGGQSSRALGINDLGQVVGFSRGGEANFNAQPFLYSDGKMIALPVHPGSGGGAAYAINNIGQIAGGDYGTGSHPVLYANGEHIDLGTLGGKGYGSALDINAMGQLVGEAPTDKEELRAFLYENGRMLDLNDLVAPDSRLILRKAIGINDSGLIAAVGSVDGETRAFRLDPLPSPVPEPSIAILFGAALLVAILRRPCRSKALSHHEDGAGARGTYLTFKR